MEPNLHLPKNDPLNRLVSRMKNGDRRAAAALYDKLSPAVYDFLIVHTGEILVAEALSEKIFLTLLKAIAEFDEKESSATAWFWQLVQEAMTHHDAERAKALVPG